MTSSSGPSRSSSGSWRSGRTKPPCSVKRDGWRSGPVRFCVSRKCSSGSKISFATDPYDGGIVRFLSDNVRFALFKLYNGEKMAKSLLLADLERAFQLLEQVDESKLEFPPDPNVSPDIRQLTGMEEYPANTHRENLRARIAAVIKAGDRLEPRDASSYVSKLIVACVRLAPPSDDSAYGEGAAP